MPDLFGYKPPDETGETARKRRDKALERVTEHNATWMERAIERIYLLSPGREVTGEDIRLFVREFTGEPEHHNAYGAMIRIAIARGLIKRTGEYRAMKTPKSHARRTPVYKVR